MDFREGWGALKAAWWLPVLGLIAGIAAGLLVTLLQTPQYVSRTQLFISTRDAGTTSSAFQGSQLSAERVDSYAELLQGTDLAQHVIDRLHLPMKPGTLTKSITATAVPDTVLIDVTVTDSSAQRAQAIAAALTAEFKTFVGTLEAPQSGAPAPVEVTVSESPTLPSSAVSPLPLRNAGFGAVAGLAGGAVVALVRARLDPTVTTAEEAVRLTGAPLLGQIPVDAVLGDTHVLGRRSHELAAERFRQVRTRLLLLRLAEPPKVILVASALEDEGRTTVAINLAVALADTGRQVALVDADLRTRRVTEYLRMPGGMGVTNVVNGAAEVMETLQPSREEGLSVVAAGPPPPNPAELLASEGMARLIDDLRVKCDVVVIDAPPVLPFADALGLAPMTDGVVLIARCGRTPKQALADSRESLDLLGIRTLGTVLNAVPW